MQFYCAIKHDTFWFSSENNLRAKKDAGLQMQSAFQCSKNLREQEIWNKILLGKIVFLQEIYTNLEKTLIQSASGYCKNAVDTILQMFSIQSVFKRTISWKPFRPKHLPCFVCKCLHFTNNFLHRRNQQAEKNKLEIDQY